MSDCLFCKIISGAILSDKVYEDDKVYAFNDINPQAPVHILLVSKLHMASAADISAANSDVVARIFEVAASIAADKGISDGWRVITNVGTHAGQSVNHLHFHLLGGRQLALDLC